MLQACCVLVVDDDTMVRMVVVRALEGAGCTVARAGNAGQALEILERGEIGIDLVLTDINMPGLDGLELGRRIGRMTPPMPVLYMSGDLPTPPAVPGEDLTFGPFLLKPFSIETLIAAVAGILLGTGLTRETEAGHALH